MAKGVDENKTTKENKWLRVTAAATPTDEMSDKHYNQAAANGVGGNAGKPGAARNETIR